MFELIILIVTVISIMLAIKIKKIWNFPAVPQLNDEWWGPGEPREMDTSIRSFKVEIQQQVLDDLHHRLNNARALTPPLEGVQQQYGMNAKLLAEIVDFWKTRYDWRETERFLNQYPQFKTNIQGLDIHFLHVKPSSAEGLKVLPLLLLHGWPGSVREFYELIPILTKPQPGRDFVFEVIASSLPGFGFSNAASKPGLSPVKVAVIYKNLMQRLGFKRFCLQGGDWGGVICSHLATLYPNYVVGAHLNFFTVRSLHPVCEIREFLKKFCPIACLRRQKRDSCLNFEEKLRIFSTIEAGYSLIQATKPDTVGVGLNDSPVGLAAYIIEKFTTWTNPEWSKRIDGGLLEKYTYTKLLDNVMIYWVTNSITTSCRIYYEQSAKETQAFKMDWVPVIVPTARAVFRHEIFNRTNDTLRYKYRNLVYTSEILNGGHFPAFEVPDVLAKEIWEGFSRILDYYKK